MSKRRILELYLNHIEFGPGIYGIGAAAHEYFGKTPDQLSRSQMIALAAILPNPLKWSPVRPNQTVLRKIRRIDVSLPGPPFRTTNCWVNNRPCLRPALRLVSRDDAQRPPSRSSTAV